LKNRDKDLEEVATKVLAGDDVEDVGSVKVESVESKNGTEGDDNGTVDLIDNLHAHQSVLDVFEETEVDTSGYQSAQPTEVEDAGSGSALLPSRYSNGSIRRTTTCHFR
jgi:hypothetical protein